MCTDAHGADDTTDDDSLLWAATEARSVRVCCFICRHFVLFVCVLCLCCCSSCFVCVVCLTRDLQAVSAMTTPRHQHHQHPSAAAAAAALCTAQQQPNLQQQQQVQASVAGGLSVTIAPPSATWGGPRSRRQSHDGPTHIQTGAHTTDSISHASTGAAAAAAAAGSVSSAHAVAVSPHTEGYVIPSTPASRGTPSIVVLRLLTVRCMCVCLLHDACTCVICVCLCSCVRKSVASLAGSSWEGGGHLQQAITSGRLNLLRHRHRSTCIARTIDTSVTSLSAKAMHLAVCLSSVMCVLFLSCYRCC